MNVSIIGTGYVGMVVGASLAAVGNRVVGYDVNQLKLERLARGECDFFEPGLNPLIAGEVEDGRLRFTSDIDDAIRHAAILFICVPTPRGDDGAADLCHVADVAGAIGDGLDGYKVIVVKSTVPVGTGDFVESIVASRTTLDFSVVSNPEFFREGSALSDFRSPHRIVVGTRDPRARKALNRLYQPFLVEGTAPLFMTRRSAELTKYTTNAMLALRISFMNEMAAIAEATGANIEEVRRGVGSDPRIGPHFLRAGIGWGGAYMGKDIEALVGVGREYSTAVPILESMREVNAGQSHRLVDKILDHFEDNVVDKRIAVWGLTFKPDTNEIRESPACDVVDELLELGVRLVVFDPAGMPAARARYGDKIECVDDEYDALPGADALAVLTDWNQFKTPDFRRIANALTHPVIFDGRNIYEPSELDEYGILTYSIGRRSPDRMMVMERLGVDG